MAKDSLAAESVRAGGAFSENRDSDPLAVRGAQSTLANTDTSGAVTLDAAADKQQRDAKSNFEETGAGQKFPEAAGQGNFSGQFSDQGYTGGPSSGNTGFSGSGTTSAAGGKISSSTSSGPTSSSRGTQGRSTGPSGGDDDSSSDIPTAPGYVTNVSAERTGKPHGKNITEGGFDADDSKNASFTTNIGSKKDPGRVAEDHFEKINEGATAGAGPRQYGAEEGTGTYDTLGGDRKI